MLTGRRKLLTRRTTPRCSPICLVPPVIAFCELFPKDAFFLNPLGSLNLAEILQIQFHQNVRIQQKNWSKTKEIHEKVTLWIKLGWHRYRMRKKKHKGAQKKKTNLIKNVVLFAKILLKSYQGKHQRFSNLVKAKLESYKSIKNAMSRT